MAEWKNKGPFFDERKCEHGLLLEDYCVLCEVHCKDADREMGLPEGEDFGDK